MRLKTIQEQMIEEIYGQAIEFAHSNEQTVGEKRDYYVTLSQLEGILKSFED